MSESQAAESQAVETSTDVATDLTSDDNNLSPTESNPESTNEEQSSSSVAADSEELAVNAESKSTEGSEEDAQQEDEHAEESPEWFMKDKYKSIEEQAKATFELQKKMGKFWGRPQDEYKLEAIEGVDKDDPLMQNIIPAIKELGLSQNGFEHLVKEYQNANIAMMKKFEAELKEELTVKDAATYQACDKWMNERLTPEEKKQVQNNWLMTPADFKLFNQLRLMAAPSTNVPSSSTGEGVRFESSREVENDKIKYRKEVASGLRVPDKNYENELAQRFRDSRSRELRSKS